MERIRTYKPDEVTLAVQQNEALLLLHFGSALASSCELIHRQLESLAPVFEGRVAFAEVELPLQDLELIQRLLQVGDDVLGVLQSDREPHHVVGDA